MLFLFCLTIFLVSSACLAEVDLITEDRPEVTFSEIPAEKVPNEEEAIQEEEVSSPREESVVNESPEESTPKEDENQCSCLRSDIKVSNQNVDTYTLTNNAASKPKPGKTYKLVTVTVPIEIDEPKRETAKKGPRADVNTAKPEKESSENTPKKEDKRFKPKEKRTKRDVKGSKGSKKQQVNKKSKSKNKK